MTWYSQLTRLIWSFYREDPNELQQLESLKRCKLSRRWGVLRIDCQENTAADGVIAAADVLREPIAQLKLAHQINILVKGALITSLPVDSSSLTP